MWENLGSELFKMQHEHYGANWDCLPGKTSLLFAVMQWICEVWSKWFGIRYYGITLTQAKWEQFCFIVFIFSNACFCSNRRSIKTYKKAPSAQISGKLHRMKLQWQKLRIGQQKWSRRWQTKSLQLEATWANLPDRTPLAQQSAPTKVFCQVTDNCQTPHSEHSQAFSHFGFFLRNQLIQNLARAELRSVRGMLSGLGCRELLKGSRSERTLERLSVHVTLQLWPLASATGAAASESVSSAGPSLFLRVEEGYNEDQREGKRNKFLGTVPSRRPISACNQTAKTHKIRQ